MCNGGSSSKKNWGTGPFCCTIYWSSHTVFENYFHFVTYSGLRVSKMIPFWRIIESLFGLSTVICVMLMWCYRWFECFDSKCSRKDLRRLFTTYLSVKVFSTDPLSRVKMPSFNEVKLYQEAISTKYPILENVYAVADGLKLHLEQSGDCVIQEMFYSDWTHDH